jgi:hypothetical protein
VTRILQLIAIVMLGSAWRPATTLAQSFLRVVALADGNTRPQPGPVQARVGEDVVLSLELVDGGRTQELPAGAQVTWLRIEPRMAHVALPPPNANTPAYSNSVLFGPHHGDWIGFDTIEYDERPLSAGPDLRIDGPRLHVRGARTEDVQRDPLGAAGSIWIGAQVVLPSGRAQRARHARQLP